MSKYLRIFFISLAICFFSICSIQAEEPLNLAPDFSLQDLSQNTVDLSSYKDKHPVILFFWTTWCPFCVRELKALSQIYPQLESEGLELFPIAVGEPRYKVENFIERQGLDLKVLLDKDADVAYAYGILGVPTYILIDKKGYIVFRGNSFPQGSYKELFSEAYAE